MIKRKGIGEKRKKIQVCAQRTYWGKSFRAERGKERIEEMQS